MVTDPANGKMTVIGMVDHVKLKKRIEASTRKTVEILNPQAKKEKKDPNPITNDVAKKPPPPPPPAPAADEKKPKLVIS